MQHSKVQINLPSSPFDCRIKIKYSGSLLHRRLALKEWDQIFLGNVFIKLWLVNWKICQISCQTKIFLIPRQVNGVCFVEEIVFAVFVLLGGETFQLNKRSIDDDTVEAFRNISTLIKWQIFLPSSAINPGYPKIKKGVSFQKRRRMAPSVECITRNIGFTNWVGNLNWLSSRTLKLTLWA